ncbi:hypothetical protein Z042_08555 [Chania multitudinisentens RB-25]|uniref:Lysine-N-methylase n=1 Tax=Chania multitudinisentens RB-25 TaxID=1441930 RepID=W0LCG2_9GAMM|nr:hypothetical protein [Chania multitudinisentens]AHG19665.1 hypothetical protein Z042_08555 [Chania multitudinisentens RB-25]
MELIDCYQPKYVALFEANTVHCICAACQKMENKNWQRIDMKMKNQQRESLDLACVTAAEKILLDPDAFVLHATHIPSESDEPLSPWLNALNQQCINLATTPSLTIEERLFALGVLLSKAQRHWNNGEQEPALLASTGEELAILAVEGVITQQLAHLPTIPPKRVAALQEMGKMHLNINLPLQEKVRLALKLSEMLIIPTTRLEEQLSELEKTARHIALFADQPHIMSNLLIYSLYHNIFPGIYCQDYGSALLALTRQFFHIKMLCALHAGETATLTAHDAVQLISAFWAWNKAHPLLVDEENTSDDRLLCGLSLL